MTAAHQDIFFPAAPRLFTTSVGFFLSQEYFFMKTIFLNPKLLAFQKDPLYPL